MKKILIISAIFVGLLILIEIGLRLLLGFGTTILYDPDEKIGYMPKPNQRIRRFGNWIEINEYSMRSAPVNSERSPSALRVLLLGDSVANGGWWIDQADTISAMMSRQLESALSKKVEVLNASANSWGPRNELAYLQRFGTFDARAVVLSINTDDLFAGVPTSVQVGRDRNYPSRQPPSALVEVFRRYIWPESPPPELKAVQEETGDRVGHNLEAIRQMQKITIQNNGHFLLAMTPLRRELGEPGPRDYEQQARIRLKEFTQIQQITYIDFLPLFNSTNQPENLYRDHIHFNITGNRLISSAIGAEIERMGSIPFLQSCCRGDSIPAENLEHKTDNL